MAIVECPFCFEILEVEPPDRLHSAFSFVKPIPKSYHKKSPKEIMNARIPSAKKQLGFSGMRRLSILADYSWLLQ